MGGRAASRWRRAGAAALACLFAFAPFAVQAEGGRSFLPIEGLRFSEAGDLTGWRVRGPGSSASELIEPGKTLLRLRVTAGGEDAGPGIAWQRLEPGPGAIAEFAGTHGALALEIRRRYERGSGPGAFVHLVEIASAHRTPSPAIRLSVELLPELRRHSPRDGSLGDYLYGYSRLFAAPAASGEFSPVDAPVAAAEVALVARHVAAVATSPPGGGGTLEAVPGSGAVQASAPGSPAGPLRLEVGALRLSAEAAAEGAYSPLVYSELWRPLGALARLLEAALQAMARLPGGAAAAVVLLALGLRVVLWPLNLWALRQQRHFAAVQARMKPEIARIEATTKGAERSEKILEAYKAHGVTPLSGLKGSAGLLVQLPILVALFAVTTESALFLDAPFLWASDLSLPDRAFALPFEIPGLGSHLNALPLALGAACVAAAAAQSRPGAGGTGTSMRPGLALALAFVVLFYSCAAALVLYWTVVNAAQVAEAPLAARFLPEAP